MDVLWRRERKLGEIVLLTLLLSAIAQATSPLTAQLIRPTADALDVMDQRIRARMADENIPGVLIGVASRGQLVHVQTYGMANVELRVPVSDSTVFEIGSISKQFVTTAIMLLVEDGRLGLDDSIHEYLPDLPSEWLGVTVRQLLTHTSGVDPDRRPLTQEELDQLPGFQNRGRLTLEESILRRANLPLNFQPGERWQYGSSTNYVALLVQRISGQNMDDFLRERIFEPLGMYDTYYNVPESKVDRTAAVYSPGEDGKIKLRRAPEYRETKYFGGVAGLSSTAADYWRFHQMILNGGEFDGVRLLSPKTVDLMITNHIGDLEVTLRGPGYGFGLGYSMLTDPGKAKESLTPGSFGWGGAYCTYFFVDPAEDMIGIFMTQISPYRHLDVRQQFSTLATQAIVESWRDRPAAIRAYPVPD